MAKASDDNKAETKGTFAKAQEKAGGLLDKAFWGGIGFTALATYIFSPLAMVGGGFVGGYVGNKAAAKYDNPKTPKMNMFRRFIATAMGTLIGVGVVFGCAFLGGVIGGPVGAVAGAAIGAAVTYKLSQKAAEKEAGEKHHALGKQHQPEKEKGKEKEQGKTFGEFLKAFNPEKDMTLSEREKVKPHQMMEHIAEKYVKEAKTPAEKKSRQQEADALVKVVGRTSDSFAQVQAQLKEGATIHSVIRAHESFKGQTRR